jgi:hypothetical protein
MQLSLYENILPSKLPPHGCGATIIATMLLIHHISTAVSFKTMQNLFLDRRLFSFESVADTHIDTRSCVED